MVIRQGSAGQTPRQRPAERGPAGGAAGIGLCHQAAHHATTLPVLVLFLLDMQASHASSYEVIVNGCIPYERGPQWYIVFLSNRKQDWRLADEWAVRPAAVFTAQHEAPAHNTNAKKPKPLDCKQRVPGPSNRPARLPVATAHQPPTRTCLGRSPSPMKDSQTVLKRFMRPICAGLHGPSSAGHSTNDTATRFVLNTMRHTLHRPHTLRHCLEQQHEHPEDCCMEQ